MSIIFILVNPAVPANVGAAARAINTMGFKELRLVNPCDHLDREARMLAHGSNHILEQAEVFKDLGQALQDIDFVIGTTARRRTIRNRFILLNQLPGIILEKGKSIRKTAIVFGSEESGLSNEDADLCDILSTIPMATKYPSLNLSQAVMVYAYELSVLAGKKTKSLAPKKDGQSWLVLKNKTEQLLDNLGMHEGDLIRYKLMERFALLGEKDVYLLHSLVGKILEKTRQ